MWGGIPYLREARWGIPYLEETYMMCGSHICRKPRWGDPISAENIDGGDPIFA